MKDIFKLVKSLQSDRCIWNKTQLRGSFFIWLHFRSSYRSSYMSSYSAVLIFNIWTRNWPAPNISGFTAQLIRAWHRFREVMASNPVEVLNIFLCFIRNCINCVHNCEDHASFDFISAVLIHGFKPRWSPEFFLGFLRNCISCFHNCEDHSSFDFISKC